MSSITNVINQKPINANEYTADKAAKQKQDSAEKELQKKMLRDQAKADRSAFRQNDNTLANLEKNQAPKGKKAPIEPASREYTGISEVQLKTEITNVKELAGENKLVP
ncbi:MAG: hypothetical protein H7A32_00280 [Deltaproteobacteria bacterium]|nr:hypothetical protein [Deltaproteobacteria bacterium]